MLRSGETFHGYLVGAALGKGGTATVYRAQRASDDGAAVALKVLADNHQTPTELARLDAEFAFADRLEHPHVVTMYDHGTGWLAMQLVDGGTVPALHTLDQRLTALAQIADALDYIHRRGIVHCDVKPANILVFNNFSASGAVLVDFGVAHSMADDAAHHPTHVQASLPYAAPELLHGHPPSAATDEYALACTMVELVTGKTPFTANTQGALVDAQLRTPPPRLSQRTSWLPHAFDSILAKAMAKSPQARYDSCSEFIQLIQRVLK